MFTAYHLHLNLRSPIHNIISFQKRFKWLFTSFFGKESFISYTANLTPTPAHERARLSWRLDKCFLLSHDIMHDGWAIKINHMNTIIIAALCVNYTHECYHVFHMVLASRQRISTRSRSDRAGGRKSNEMAYLNFCRLMLAHSFRHR